MTKVSAGEADWGGVEGLLVERGAGVMEHPGGTLLGHLRRVRRMLAEWGADAAVQAAGLSHAAYGTDGFDRSLLAVTERGVLAELVGERAESLVYLYGSCARDQVYPQLGEGSGPGVFRDRFTGAERTPAEADLRAFVEITAANELDVLAHNEELAAQHGPGLYGLLRRARGLLSEPAWQACRRQLGEYAA